MEEKEILEGEAQKSWRTLEENVHEESSLKTYSILLSLVKNENKLEEMLRIIQIGDGLLDLKKCEKLQNCQSFANLLLHAPNNSKKVTKEMKIYFNEKIGRKMRNIEKGWFNNWHPIKVMNKM